MQYAGPFTLFWKVDKSRANTLKTERRMKHGLKIERAGARGTRPSGRRAEFDDALILAPCRFPCFIRGRNFWKLFGSRSTAEAGCKRRNFGLALAWQHPLSALIC